MSNILCYLHQLKSFLYFKKGQVTEKTQVCCLWLSANLPDSDFSWILILHQQQRFLFFFNFSRLLLFPQSNDNVG